MYKNNSHLLDIIIVFLLLPLMLYSGCTPLHLPQLEDQTPNSRVIAAAERLFINGNFEKALVEYEQLLLTSMSPREKNHALYGLGCTQMILAENEQELITAIDTLSQWDIQKGTAPFGENRHLLILALQQQATLIEQKNKRLAEKEQQRSRLIADQEKQISQLTSQLQKLQKQLLALEKVDENVQEKRKPL